MRRTPARIDTRTGVWNPRLQRSPAADADRGAGRRTDESATECTPATVNRVQVAPCSGRWADSCHDPPAHGPGGRPREFSHTMRIRAAKIEELTPKPRERALSPRQLAALQREEEIRKALARLKSDEDILAIELDPSEKIPTMRAAVKKAIAAHKPGTNMAIRGRTIYLSTGTLARRPRPQAEGCLSVVARPARRSVAAPARLSGGRPARSAPHDRVPPRPAPPSPSPCPRRSASPPSCAVWRPWPVVGVRRSARSAHNLAAQDRAARRPAARPRRSRRRSASRPSPTTASTSTRQPGADGPRRRSRPGETAPRRPRRPTPTPQRVKRRRQPAQEAREPLHHRAVDHEWCAVAGTQMVLAMHGKAPLTRVVPEGARVPDRRVGEPARQPQRRLGTRGDGRRRSRRTACTATRSAPTRPAARAA